MPRIPFHRFPVVSDCLLIVALRLGYRTTVEVMLPNYWRCDYDGERAEGKTDQRQSNRRFPIRQTANCVNSNQQRPEHKAGPADPKEGKGREKSNMRDDSRVMKQRELQTGKVRGQRILHPLKKSGTKNQKAANDEQPVGRPELGPKLRPRFETLLPFLV